MKRSITPLLTFFVFLLSGCSAIEGIFKAGAYTGIIAVVIVIIVIVGVIAMFRKKS